jgi:hypothetical protein
MLQLDTYTEGLHSYGMNGIYLSTFINKRPKKLPPSGLIARGLISALYDFHQFRDLSGPFKC